MSYASSSYIPMFSFVLSLDIGLICFQACSSSMPVAHHGWGPGGARIVITSAGAVLGHPCPSLIVPHVRMRYMWQNRLNYSDSSALVIAIQPILTQRTSNGTTHWFVGSPPDTTTVQQIEVGLPRMKASLQSHNSSPTLSSPE
jgi:hypothetical protein